LVVSYTWHRARALKVKTKVAGTLKVLIAATTIGFLGPTQLGVVGVGIFKHKFIAKCRFALGIEFAFIANGAKLVAIKAVAMAANSVVLAFVVAITEGNPNARIGGVVAVILVGTFGIGNTSLLIKAASVVAVKSTPAADLGTKVHVTLSRIAHLSEGTQDAKAIVHRQKDEVDGSALVLHAAVAEALDVAVAALSRHALGPAEACVGIAPAIDGTPFALLVALIAAVVFGFKVKVGGLLFVKEISHVLVLVSFRVQEGLAVDQGFVLEKTIFCSEKTIFCSFGDFIEDQLLVKLGGGRKHQGHSQGGEG